MRRGTWFVLACVVGCDRSPAASPPPPATPHDAAIEWLAPTTSDDDILTVPAHEVSSGRYELHFGTGVILLDLVTGSVVAPDPARGAVALEALARWLKQPVPVKTHGAPLRPVAFQAIDMGDGDHKVFFSVGAEYAEMYINVKEPTHVELVPKDPGYAGGLISIFADALRDGPEPPRTPVNDPNLESDQPLFVSSHPIELEGVHDAYCAADGWIGFRADKTHDAALRIPWRSGAPVKVCELPGAVDYVAVGSRSPNALALVTARAAGSAVIRGGTPATLWAIDAKGCHRIATPPGLALHPFDEPVLSPDGTQVAVTKESELVIFPVGKGKVFHVARAGLMSIYTWDDDGIQLRDLDGTKGQKLIPGSPVTDTIEPTTSSPDGAFSAVMLASGLDMFDRTRHTLAHFTPHVRGDIRAIERANHRVPAWIAPHRLILGGRPDIALDAATLESRPLARAGTFLCASPDSTHALFTDDQQALSEAP